MERIITGDAISQIKDFLEGMINPVHALLFTNKTEASEVTKQVLLELTELNPKLTLEEVDYNTNSILAKGYGLTGAPSFVLLNEKRENQGVLYHGIPLGHEINSLLTGILDVSGHPSGFDQATIDYIKSIDKEVDMKVFVTLSCPHCPGAVSTAHKIALLNPKIKASMVEAQTFQDEAVKYQVSGVPKIVFNDTKSLLGNQPIGEFVKTLKTL